MRYSVLGRLLIDGERAEARLPGRKERSVLAVLLAQHGSVMSEPDLVRVLWGDQPPSTAARSLASHVSRVRRVTGDALRREGSGWALDAAGELDSARMTDLVGTCERAAADGAWVEAQGLVTLARSLWRGAPFDGLTSLEPCAAEAARLVLVRARMEELSAACRLATGQGPELVDELRALVDVEPLREERWSLLMTALFRAGRQAEALEAYRQARVLLRDELGIEPSAQLARTHARVLAADPTLLAQLRATEPGDAAEQAAVEAPYPGLSSYGAAEAAVFLGRERVVARLLERLAASGRVTLAGASGSGKSSVLDAGVLPALRGGGLPGSESWRIRRWRVGDELVEGDADLLVVDQLEEIFTLADPPTRRQMADDLRVRATCGTRLLLAVRSDFWSRCADEPALAELVADSSWLLSPLSADELRRVAVEPPRRLGVTVDPALAEAVVEAVGARDGVLPLLSTALARAWELRSDTLVTLADYRRGGGIEDAVARLAEEVYARLEAPARKTARAIMLRLTTDGPDGLVVGHRAPAAEVLALGPGAGDVLEHLVAGRLVVTGARGVELVHEVLLTGWPRLAGWLAEDAAARRLRRHLTPAAAEWDRRGRRDEDLYTGARLAETSIVVDEHIDVDGGAPLAAREREFLDAAWRRADVERVQALATATRDRRRVRQLRGLLAGALVLVVLAGLLTVAARRERDRAGEAERAAVAGSVGSAALLEPRPDLALLLAAQGYTLAPDPATASNLFGVVLRFPRLVHATNLGYRVTGTAMSPDGRYLATCSNRGGLYLLDPGDLTVVRTVVPPQELSCSQPAFSLDGEQLSSTWQVEAGEGAELRVYDASDGALLAREPARDGYFTSVSDDGRRILTSAYLASYLWRRTATGWQRRQIGPRDADVRVSEVGPDGEFALSTPGEPVTVRRSKDGAVIRRMAATRGWQVGEDITADGEVAVFEPLGRRIVVRDLATGLARLRIDTPGDLVFVQVAAGDRLVVATDLNGGTTVWDSRTGRLRLSVQATSGQVSAEVAPDGDTLFLAGDDGTLLSADLTGTRGFGADLTVPAGVVDATYTGDGSSIVVATDAGRVVALDATTLDVEASTELTGATAGLSPGDGATVLVVADDAVTVLDASRRLAVLDRVGVAGAVAADRSPDGVLAVATSPDPGLVLVRPDGSRQQVTLPLAADRVTWSPDGAVVAAALTDSSVRLFDGGDGTILDVVPATDDPVSTPLAFLDPTTLLVARRDGTLQSWDVAAGAYVGDPVPATGGRPTSLSVAGGLAVVGSIGAGVALVDPVAGVRYGGGLLPGGQEGLIGLIDPDLRTLTVLTSQGSARRWPASPEVWRSRACEVASRSLSEVEWRRHLPGQDYGPAC